jgi:hypothetical protein
MQTQIRGLLQAAAITTTTQTNPSPHHREQSSAISTKLQPSPLPPKPRRRGRSHHQPTNAITTPPPFSTLPQSPPLPCSQTTINTKTHLQLTHHFKSSTKSTINQSTLPRANQSQTIQPQNSTQSSHHGFKN